MRSHTKKGVGTAFPPHYSPDNSHRKKSALTPYVTVYDETKIAGQLWLLATSRRHTKSRNHWH